MSDFEQYRRELHVHCYRMLASYEQAEDAVQETFLRAWRGREGFDGANARAWLYKIATNICVDQARTAKARTEVAWLTPYPDRELDEPHVVAVARETIELAFLTALQVLPGRQRAALLAKEVLGLSAAEIADLLGVSVAAANSALQRARATLRDHLPARRDDWAAREPSAAERDLLARFIDAHERCDAPAALAVAAEDIRVTMPPNPLRFDGRDAIAGLLERAFGPERDGDWRLLPTSANRMPAAASYLRRPGDTEFRAFKLDVLRVVGGEIAEITTFGYALFDHFGLPTRLV
ncbi:RNA polymerase subunit sigma-70 [Actinokineospora globicatena]|uniref:RNA polymerase sigma factor n=1 Tax=Actinokineospora globicatena TaxID=103729 RepID=A0A9W6VBG5_9PSEU|nr:RNA polymerase subunit sigma-70 [Actinokineospora globicatena]GLW93964.1 RNA polymerase sigma factor [Actinokineospora globicatena]